MLTPIRRVKRRDPIAIEEPTTPSKRVKREQENEEIGMATPPHTPKKTGYSKAKAMFERGSRTRKFVGRDEEREFIRKFVDERLGKSAGSLYVSGVPGTGKSAMVTQVLNAYNKNPAIKTAIINCMTVDQADFIFPSILAAFKYTTTASKLKAVETLAQKFKEDSITHILMLDEIDHLMQGDQEVLFQLFEWSCMPDTNLILIGIANSLDLTDRFLPRLEANDFIPEVLAVKPYTKEAIFSVLEGQLNDDKHLISTEALEFFSGKVASQTGDLRRAFDLCARSLQIAEQEWLIKGEHQTELVKVKLEHALKVCQEAFGSDSTLSKIRGLNYIQQCVLVTLLIMEHKSRTESGHGSKAFTSIDVANHYGTFASKEPSWTLLDIQEVMQVLTALESTGLVVHSGLCGKRGLGSNTGGGNRVNRGGGGATSIGFNNSNLSSRRVKSRIPMMDAFSAFTHDVLKRLLCDNL